jgi:ABC-2 type transport system permease protein
MKELKKIIAFIQRDFKILISYRVAFSSLIVNMLFNLFYFIIFGSMFGNRMPEPIAPYQQDFITYILMGSVGWSFLWSITSSASTSIRSEMMMGTLESILLTSTKITTLVISYTIFGCFIGALSSLVLILIGYFVFDTIIYANIYTILILLVSIVIMTGFGMIFSGLTLWIKNIGDFIPLFQNISMFFCGVYFPITILPHYMQKIAKFIPFYYSIEGMRLSIINPVQSIKYILILILFSLIITILGFYSLRKGLKKAKRDGSLSFY